MVWNNKKKLIFIHIPKTGGTTIEEYMNAIKKPTLRHGYGVFKNIVFQHFRWNDYIDFMGIDSFNNYTKFSIVRNPYERIISEYYWTPTETNLGYKSNKDFNSFLNNVKDIVKNKKYNDTIYHDHFIPQYEFICNKDNNIVVDHLFRFENFDKVLNFLKDNEYKINKNKKENQCIYQKKINLTKKQKNIIYNLYKKDFKIFNYSK